MKMYQVLFPVAFEALLLFLLSRLLFACVISSFADRRGKGLWLGLLRLPGNFVHEISHCLGFLVCGYRVQRVLLCVFDRKGRGSCSPGRPWSPVTCPQFAIGLSALMPLVLGSLILVGVARWLGILDAMPDLQPQALLPGVWQQALKLVHALHWQQWQTWLFLYLALSIGAELSPSSTDLRYAIPTLLGLTAGIWLFFFALDHAQNLQHLRHLSALVLTLVLVRIGSVLSIALVLTAAAAALTLLPGLTVQALRRH